MTDQQPPLQDTDIEAWKASNNLGAQVSALATAVIKGMEKEFSPFDLAPIEFGLLRICLEQDDEVTATYLVRHLPVDSSRISRIVTDLVDRGLIERRRLRDDRRVVMLRLTGEGRELATQMFEKMAHYYSALTEGLDEGELQAFMTTSSKIVANHDAMQESE